MPFQSEKQRRFLHANHPEIAKRWERDYAHGGILDINESEEIIDDGGNDIELTAYNAAFDDPNDFSTGVKSLFRAKEGGNVRLGPHKATDLLVKKTSTGERPKYQPPGHRDAPVGGPPGGGATSMGSGRDYSPSPSVSVGGSDQEDDVAEMMSNMGLTQDHTPDHSGDRGWVTPEDEYGAGDYRQPGWELNDSKEGVTIDRNHLEEMKKVQLSKLKSRGLKKVLVPLALMIFAGVPPVDALKHLPKTLSINPEDLRGVIIESLPVAKARKELITSLEDYKKKLEGTGLPTHNPHIDTEWQKTTQALLDLTQKPEGPEDTGGDAPALPPQLGGPSTEEMAIEYDWMGAVRERQAQKKAYDEKIEREKLAREDNPIVSGTEMDIIALGNSGGLANLFRVKKQ